MSRTQRLSFVGIAAAIAVVGFVFAASLGGQDEVRSTSVPGGRSQVTGPRSTSTDGDGAKTTAKERPRAFRIRVRGGRPEGGVARVRVKAGETVALLVKSDVADEVHVHGYDLSEHVPAGGSMKLEFKATLEGIYEVELERSHVQIARLEVRP